MVGLFHDTKYKNAGFAFVYDFKLMKGSLMMFSSPPRKYVKGTIHGKIYNGRLNCDCVGVFKIEEDEGYFYFADDFYDEWSYSKYFAIIHDSDDETVYSQLNAALLTCSNMMNL